MRKNTSVPCSFSNVQAELFEYVRRLDEAILLALANCRTPLLNRIVIDITSLGSFTVISLISAAAFTMLWLVAEDRRGAATIVTAAAGAEVLVEAIKRLLQYPRPAIVPYLVEFTGFSYPSGHALVATATYSALAMVICGYLERRRDRIAVRAICWIVIAKVAVSRVYLGVHYPTDVLGGVLLGIAWVHFTSYLWRGGRLVSKRQTHDQDF
jgi:undecaprenyl-diphosphatase